MSHEVPSRPLLLPQNRRLRHLQGVYLRNLSFTRPRGHTIDDAAINKTPAKLKALRESLREPSLHHAQSSDDLPRKARPGRMRRRSTNWAAQSPGVRQKKLEDVIESGTADTFFSLHSEGTEDPLYISEVVEKTMNPSFRFFDLTNYGASVQRLSTIRIKVWVKRLKWNLFLDDEMDLASLNFVGKLANHPLPSNCVLFHLIDGIYAMNVRSEYPQPRPAPALPTSSYSALMRLSSLDDSIQDALVTREAIASQINAILADMPQDKTAQAEDAATISAKYVASSRKLLKASMKRRSELLASIAARRRAIEQGKSTQANAQTDVDNAQEKLQSCRTLITTNNDHIHGQRRRICEELLHIFPIEPTNQPLLFTVCGLTLPNTSFDDASSDSDEVYSAALGFVARLVDMLQYYLAVPLPYPVTPYGSRSIIRDNISTLQDSQRTFPLYTKGAVRFRFDYAVFLLNKDIECLAESQGCKVIDIRHTLPNLKYLLYVCSAGAGDLPARKAGGIRGLLAGRAYGPILSRTGSEDSAAMRKKLQDAGIKDHDSQKVNDGRLIVNLPFGDDERTTLRTKGMRENVVR